MSESSNVGSLKMNDERKTTIEMGTKELLTVNEFAAALNVTPACVRRWLLERRINSYKISRLVRIPASEVQRFQDEGYRPARGTK